MFFGREFPLVLFASLSTSRLLQLSDLDYASLLNSLSGTFDFVNS